MGRSLRRKRVAMALKLSLMLFDNERIGSDQRGWLKEITLDHDPRVMAALKAYEADGSAAELLDSFLRLAHQGRT